MTNKVTAIIQARMGSSRLPGKVLLPLGREEKPVLQHLIERVKRAKTVDDILVVTTNAEEDNIIEKLALSLKCKCWRGKYKYVLDNILDACEYYDTDIIVDITADCPLIDPRHIDDMVKTLKRYQSDVVTYVSNVVSRTWPRGFDLQVYRAITLRLMAQIISVDAHRNHSGWNIMMHETLQRVCNVVSNYYHPDWRLCIDEEEDYVLMNFIFHHFNNNKFSAEEVIEYLEKNPKLLDINKDVKQKEVGRG
jgi:spore coat polysaccharide biosynthesis protein SpsF